jgi:cupin fold WbuC family metalloprotein
MMEDVEKEKGAPSIVRLDRDESVRVDDGKNSVAYFCRESPSRVDREVIRQLKEVFERVGNRNVRLCLHADPSALHHDMIVLERKGGYYRPHKHEGKGETFHIVEFAMGVFTFDDDGGVVDACVLEPEGCLAYRVGDNTYHAVLPVSDMVIYHESKLGPFTGEGDSIYPAWAPDGADADAVARYHRRLRDALGL